MQELMYEAEGDFYGFMRMTPAAFQEILLRVTPRITKVHCLLIFALINEVL